MANPLSKGTIREILLNPNNLPKNPVLQVLALKKVNSGQGANERYRMVISDGVHAHTCAMLATQLNHMVSEDQIDTKAVIRLDKYICNVIQETRKVLILLEVTVVHKGRDTPRYGDPKQFDEKSEQKASTSEGIQNNRPSVQQSSGNAKTYQAAPSSNNSRFGSKQPPASRAGSQNTSTVFPISSLNPYNNRWTICARVTSKSSIREWNNAKGSGRLFNVDFIDESGEIRATCFTDLVDKYYPMLELNKIYYISKGSLRPANKKYSSIKNDYELTFNNETSITLCTEKDDLPTLQFNFFDIIKIQDVQPEILIDLIGVCVNISDMSEITTRAGKQIGKRDISLIDKTAMVKCTLWGKDAENFEQHMDSNPVVAIKGAKVSDFGGRSLSLLTSSVMQVNPDNLEEAFKLRGWYDSVDSIDQIASISGVRGEGMNSNVYKTMREITSERLGMSEKPDYFNVLGSVSYYRKENCLYKSCPKPECNKKVIEDGDHYRCEKCNQTYPNFNYRYLLRVNVSDHTGEHWLTCFQDAAQKLLERSASEMGELQETDDSEFMRVFGRKNFNTKVFRVRAKMDKYNDEARISCTVDKVSPIDYSKEGRRLADQIDKTMEKMNIK